MVCSSTLSPGDETGCAVLCWRVIFTHPSSRNTSLSISQCSSFCPGRRKLPMKLVQLLKGSCKSEHLHYPSISSHACLSSTPLPAGNNTEVMPEIGTFKQPGCAVLKNTGWSKFPYKNSTRKWPCKVFTSCVVPWLLMNCLNNEKSSPFTPPQLQWWHQLFDICLMSDTSMLHLIWD